MSGHLASNRENRYYINRRRSLWLFGQIAQLVEHCPEKAGVPGSSPGLTTPCEREESDHLTLFPFSIITLKTNVGGGLFSSRYAFADRIWFR